MKNQADWLFDLRSQLFRKANIRARKNILDIGSGTGIITKELFDRSKSKVTGVDIKPDRIDRLKKVYPEIEFICADALNLPFKNESFDLIITSWLWVWIKDKQKLASEIKRLLTPNGVYISLAEKDSDAIIEYPSELELKKEYLISFIQKLGGDPFIARKIPALFNDKNLNIQFGAFSSMFNFELLESNINNDYESLIQLKDSSITIDKLERLRRIEINAIKDKTRFSFAPVFWLYVLKPQLF